MLHYKNNQKALEIEREASKFRIEAIDNRIAKAREEKKDVSDLLAERQDEELRFQAFQRENSFELIKLKEGEAEEIRDIERKAIEDREKLQEEALKKEQDNFKARIKMLSQFVNEAVKIQNEQHQQRLKQIDEELKTNEKTVSYLEGLADQQAESTERNLASEQKKKAELEAQREREIKKQKLRELGLAGIQAFVANLENDPNTALPKTISDITLLSAAIQDLGAGFYHGTDDTGTTGVLSDKYGPITGFTHAKERVFNADETKEMNLLGATSRDKALDLIRVGQAAKIDGLKEKNEQEYIIERRAYMTNDSLLREVQIVARKLDELPSKMPENKWELDGLFRFFKHHYSRGGKTENNYYKP